MKQLAKVRTIVGALQLESLFANPHPEIKTVYSAYGMKGEVRGERACHLDGCGGVRLCVRWPDGHTTWPCIRGMRTVNGAWRIL